MPNSYKKFCDMVTGYRMFRILEQAVQSGIIDLLDAGAKTAGELISSAKLRQEEGERFISSLLEIGILTENSKALSLSSFSQKWLSSSSPTSQRGVLEFEPILIENWNNLDVVLNKGQGALAREKTAEEYATRLDLFQRAMGEAAVLRAGELWNALLYLPEKGKIIDIGAGDAVYLKQFLNRYPRWSGVACDLNDVCQRGKESNHYERLSFHSCNILDDKEMMSLVSIHIKSADIVLLSNFCHCYSKEENVHILQQAAKLLTKNGLLIVHDFFRDTSVFGAMYDLHLMVNTYNGHCFSRKEMNDMLEQSGLYEQNTITLPSGSVAIIYDKSLF